MFKNGQFMHRSSFFKNITVDSAQNSQISSILQTADCLLKLIEKNKQVAPINSLNRSLNHTAQLSISCEGGIIYLSEAPGK